MTRDRIVGRRLAPCSFKENMMKRFLTVIVCLVFLGALLSTAGCETWKGAGKDVGHVGDSMAGEE